MGFPRRRYYNITQISCNESIIVELIFSCGRFSSLSESSVSLEDSILFWKSNCLFTSYFLILATPLFSTLSGLVLSLTELHENEIASGQWTSEKRKLKSCTVKFTNDLKKYGLLIQ